MDDVQRDFINVLKYCVDKDSINELSPEMQKNVLSCDMMPFYQKSFQCYNEISPELKTFRYNDQTVEFSVGIGIVVKVTRYSRTSINGSGGGGSISTSYGGYTSGYIRPINIKGESVDILDIWVKSLNGNVNCLLIGPCAGFLEGDPVCFTLLKYSDIEPLKTALFKNIFDANQFYSMANSGRPYVILKNNPSGLFKNPAKKQSEYDDALHAHNMKIQNYITDQIKANTDQINAYIDQIKANTKK